MYTIIHKQQKVCFRLFYKRNVAHKVAVWLYVPVVSPYNCFDIYCIHKPVLILFVYRPTAVCMEANRFIRDHTGELFSFYTFSDTDKIKY